MTDNLDLWKKVQTTDPDHTKDFNRGGGFKGTGINATYLVKKATEVFGPMGINWGVDIVDERFIDGHILDAETGQKSVVHYVRISLWYINNGTVGRVYHFGQTVFVGKYSTGIFTDDEAPKKSLTDATTKALSMLGFSADVFLGLYDDVHYVQDLKNDASLAKAEDKEQHQDELNAEYGQWKADNIRLISTAGSLKELLVLFNSAHRKMKRNSDDAGIALITEARDTAKDRLNNQEQK